VEAATAAAVGDPTPVATPVPVELAAAIASGEPTPVTVAAPAASA